jgi:hypothetical protein
LSGCFFLRCISTHQDFSRDLARIKKESTMDATQFYPTPKNIAERMLGKFKASPFDRDACILEPSAGDGALIKAAVQVAEEDHQERLKSSRMYWRRDPLHVDFIEIDMTKHSALKDIAGVKGAVIGLDFLQFSGSIAAYTHVLMNPPFNAGVHHVLKAWEGLYDGEIVALLNAETVKNPFSKERQHLVRLIEQHGDVEFVQDAFKGEGVEREADVEVAIVHLVKKANIESDVIGDVLSALEEDTRVDGGAAGFASQVNGQELAIPGDVIEMTVRAFNAAVKTMQEAVVAQAKAGYYRRLVGQTMAQRNGDQPAEEPTDMVAEIRRGIASGYIDLKDRAWSQVLRSTKVSSKLSSKGQQRLEADFEKIKRLDFSASNVYAFLIGLIEAQGDMHLQMAMDCFDEITKYHEDNCVWYMGWKSNTKHRTAGRRIKMTRFILPGFSGSWSRKSLGYTEELQLRDFDKVFAVLDGKQVEQTFGLADLFKRDGAALGSGERLSADYFDVRWYPGVGTVHFFPKRKDLIDRLNRLVGRARQWLPEREDLVSKDFWLAYERAEKYDAKVRKEVGRSSYCDPFWLATRGNGHGDDEASASALDTIAGACLNAAQADGLDPTKGLEHAAQPQQLLLEAA